MSRDEHNDVGCWGQTRWLVRNDGRGGRLVGQGHPAWLKAKLLEKKTLSVVVMRAWGADAVGQFADRREAEERTGLNCVSDEWVGL